MQEGRSAAEIAQDEERLVDDLIFVGGEEDVVEPEEEPVDQVADGPDEVEEDQEDEPFAVESSGGVTGAEE